MPETLDLTLARMRLDEQRNRHRKSRAIDEDRKAVRAMKVLGISDATLDELFCSEKVVESIRREAKKSA